MEQNLVTTSTSNEVGTKINNSNNVQFDSSSQTDQLEREHKIQMHRELVKKEQEAELKRIEEVAKQYHIPRGSKPAVKPKSSQPKSRIGAAFRSKN